MTEEQANESRDGTGSGDHDEKFEFGHPLADLLHWQQAGLLLIRGQVKDAKSGKRGGRADGDLAYTVETPSGLSVPMTDPSPFWTE